MLMDLLQRAARRSPAKIAIVHGERRIRYDQLLRRVESFANGLAGLGIGPGDCLALLLQNCPELIVALFACASRRAILLPLNPELADAEIRRLIVDAAPKGIVTGAARLSLSQALAAERGLGPPILADHAALPGSVAFEALCRDAGLRPAAAPYAGRALYLYTSGSTDSLKRVCCTQENLYYEAHNFLRSTGIGAEDTILCTIPLYHSYGLGNCLLDAVYAGAALVLEAGTAAPFAARHRDMLALLRREGVRVYPGVPFQFEVLANSEEDVAAAFREVRWCISSGDVLPRRVFDRFRARTGLPIRSLYGSTEAGSIAMDCGPAEAVEFGTLGRPLENVAIEIRPPAGQIWVKSPGLAPGGYDDRPEINAAVFRGGFYDSGDVGRLDERGRLVLTGRKQTFFDVGGHKVDLAEVEDVLRGVPKVRDAAAIGIEVPRLGGVIKAVVAAAETCRETEILDHCRRHLAAYKVPRLVEFREMLPRSPLGKLLRKELADAPAWLADVPSLDDLARLPPAGRKDWLAERIREQVATVLGLVPAAVPRDVPFQGLGFDSLRVIELQERLSRMAGMALSVITLWNHASVDAYAAFLLGAMQGVGAVGESQPADALDTLAEEELARLLAAELRQAGAAGGSP